jgi:apolipoprotein D and lipocalin family protein
MNFQKYGALLGLLVAALLMPASYASASIQTVAHVDVSRYATTWYKIAGNPLFFEANCVCAIQKFSPGQNGAVNVTNSCNMTTPAGELRSISGTATSEDPSTNARFSVDFGLPQKGEYWIIGLDSDYRYAVVSDPSEKSLYILSSTPTLDPALYNEALMIAQKQVDTSKLQMTLQTGCTYP